MSGIANLLGIGKSALLTTQRALAVTGQNIANVNTPGYTRQEAVLSATRPLDGRPGQIGTGVQATQIRRALDTFIERQMLASHEQLGRFDVLRRVLFQIQELFSESGEQSIGAALNAFFSALQDVANSPQDLTARSVFLAKAATLAARFNQVAADLNDHRRSLDRQVSDTITEINSRAEQIASLNNRIAQAEAGGQNANDLRDQRGRLLNEIAERIEISALEDASGQVTILVGRGLVLVEQDHAYKLVGVPSSANGGLLDVSYDDGGENPVAISSVIASGRLKGLLAARDSTIPGLLGSLNALASALVTEVNAQHQLGYGLDGSTGQNVFSSSGTTAATISVSLTDGKKLAAAASLDGVPGNNANALALIALQSKSLTSLGGATLTGYYGTTVADLGSSAQGADRDLRAQEILHEQLEAQRAAVSGVSLDEELVNLIAQQRAFEAAARLIVMTDELLQTILALTR